MILLYRFPWKGMVLSFGLTAGAAFLAVGCFPTVITDANSPDPNLIDPNLICPDANAPEPNCPVCPDPNDFEPNEPEPNVPHVRNSTDPTNSGAFYLGRPTCAACHPEYEALHRISGHAYKLQRLRGGPPTYAPEGTRAGIPNPPDGKEWTDLTYVIGGYHRKGRFVDAWGYTMTDGVDGVNTQWNLSFPPNGTEPGWTSYEPGQVDPKPYGYSCFVCHTTGPDPNGLQDNLPGLQGTFAEPGVQCEACHGPGSNHVGIPPDPNQIYVNEAASACGTCHTRGGDPNVVLASGGYIRHHEQWPELLAGAHHDLDCVECHNPHASANYDRDNAIIQECEDCHADHNMAFHQGKVYTRGGYVERLTCESCHMPYATKSAAAATAAVIGPNARMGDVKTHIFYINTNAVDYNTMFDGNAVAKDAEGRAAVTVDFVCLRCHNGIGNAFELPLAAAAAIGFEMHDD